jgi:hypothetical protein
MIAFLKIDREIRSVLKPIIEEHNFQLNITDYEIEMTNDVCRILIGTERYYPELSMKIINPKKQNKNSYQIGRILHLGKFFDNPNGIEIFSGEGDSNEEIRISTLKDFHEWLKLYCHDLIAGDFEKFDRAGYWTL